MSIIFTECEAYKLPKPIIKEDFGGFMIEFKKNIGKDVPVNERQKQIISILKENFQINIIELAQKLNFNRKTIQRDLKKLKELNILKRIGSDKTGYWKIIDKKYE